MIVRWLAAQIVAVPHSSTGVTLTAAASTGFDPTTALTVYGPIGLVCVLLVVGWLVPKYAYDRVVAENERLKTLVEQTTPLVARNSEVTAEAIALIHLLQAQIASRPRGSRT